MESGLDINEKYSRLPERSFMSVPEALSLCELLAERVYQAEPKVDVILAIANGAIPLGKVMEERFGLPAEVVKVRRSGSRIKRKLKAIKDFLHIPSSLITAGPFLYLWGQFQIRHSALETDDSSFSFDVTDKTVLLVDDCMVSGDSVKYVRDKLIRSGAKRVIVATLCYEWRLNKPQSPVTPDYYLHRTFHFYPWSNNSPYWNDFVKWLKEKGLKLWE